jgi:serine/threonine protein kinase
VPFVLPYEVAHGRPDPLPLQDPRRDQPRWDGDCIQALDLNLKREVALKVLPPELVSNVDRKRRFVQEAQAAAALKHPNIAQVYEIDNVDGVDFIAMELVEGEKLKDLLRRERLPDTRALDLAIEVAEGLSSAHDKGIVHRDLKPSNIMVDEHGPARIIDFGLAKLLEPLGAGGSNLTTAFRGETQAGQLLGTISYMSFEQASGGPVDHRSDIFSFGVVLQEMLTGEHPFEGATNVDTLHAILRNPPPRLAEKDSALQPLLDRCLANDPSERYESMHDLDTELQELREQTRSTAQPRASSAGARKTPWRWSAVLGIALAGIAIGWFFFGGGRPPVTRLCSSGRRTRVARFGSFPQAVEHHIHSRTRSPTDTSQRGRRMGLPSLSAPVARIARTFGDPPLMAVSQGNGVTKSDRRLAGLATESGFTSLARGRRSGSFEQRAARHAPSSICRDGRDCFYPVSQPTGTISISAGRKDRVTSGSPTWFTSECENSTRLFPARVAPGHLVCAVGMVPAAEPAENSY